MKVDRAGPTSAKIQLVSVDKITDRLYALTPEAFTQARNEAEPDAGANADAL